MFYVVNWQFQLWDRKLSTTCIRYGTRWRREAGRGGMGKEGRGRQQRARGVNIAAKAKWTGAFMGLGQENGRILRKHAENGGEDHMVQQPCRGIFKKSWREVESRIERRGSGGRKKGRRNTHQNPINRI
ncbi:hypothetical protein DFH09DRAFT_1287560 [Mycena vulgaris]|nr:hypothetical protein DFH09DRAFT_1287560 [Mycena vulgaris]